MTADSRKLEKFLDRPRNHMLTTAMNKRAAEIIPPLGPAMAALTEKQRAFVLALRELPDRKGRFIEAYRRAGFDGTPDTVKTGAHRLAHHPKILAAIKEVAFGMMSCEGIGMISMLLDIAYGDIPANASERMKAAGMVLNRIGMSETTQHKVQVEHTVNNEDQLEKLYRFARVLNIEPKQLLGSMGLEVIDGEFVESADVDRVPGNGSVDPVRLIPYTDDPFSFDGTGGDDSSVADTDG